MSGSLRRLLGLALTRQQRRIRDAQTFLGNNGDYTTARANIGITLVGTLKVSYNEYEKIDRDWQSLIESLTDATEKANEEALYQEHAFDDKTKTPFQELMADLLAAIGDIESEISIIDRTIAAQNAATAAAAQAAAVTAAQVAAAAAQPAGPAAAPATITVPSQMVLLNNPGQETKKRLFNGDAASYKGFVDDWNNSVGNKTDITDVLKLQMLKQRVEGEAFSAICRYSTAAEYPEALAKLKQRFGRERDAIAIHLKKLAIPVHDKNDLSAVRRAFDDFEFHLVALNGYGQDIEAAHFKELLKSKLPEEVLNQLSMFERTLATGDATVTEYRKQADLIIADVTTTYGRFLPRVIKTNVKQIIPPKTVAFVPYDGQKSQRPQVEKKFAAKVGETLEKSDILQTKENVNLSNVKVLLSISKKSVNVKRKGAEKDCEKPNPVVARVTAEELTSDPKFLYELELMWIVDDPNADEYRLFRQRFLETVEQHPDGRIYVELPFHDLTNLGTNYNNCYRRLNSQVKRFLRDPEYAALYKKAVDEFVENKFTEVVSNEVLNDADTHFMPHSLVIKPGKTTSARLVIDGSCKTEKGESLNDKLLIGDNRLPDLAGVLLRSRFYPIIVASDIKKAFLQVHLKPDSQKYVRFLFVKDLEKPLTRENLVVYQFLVNPFGLSSSPNILAHAIEFHLKKFAQECQEFAPYLLQVLRNNYVDNLVLGSKLVEEAITANEIVKRAFAGAKMDLRGHVSNSPGVNKHFGVDVKSFNLLGHELDILTDELTFGWKKLDPLKPPKTKKELVSFSASLFDLLGILEPLRVPIKLLIRKAWDHKSDWKSLMDKALIEDVRVLYEERLDFCIRLKRKVFQNDPKIVQLLVFADASEKAYGVVVYLRYMDKNGKFYTTLIFAKSRIAALKIIMTITKLELTATALALHVVEFIKAQLKDVVIIEKVIIFTDSSTVLYWIKNPEGKGRYVINRVNKLRESDAEFRHVPGTLNPADLVSRGCSPRELVNNRLWFEGPEFLRKAEEFWPIQPNLEEVAEQLEPLIVATFKRQDSEKIIIEGKAALVDATKFRNWHSLVGTYVVILKFLLKKSKSFCKKVFEVDQPDEIQILKQAEIVLIKNI